MTYVDFIRRHPRLLAFGFSMTLFSSFGQTFFVAQFNEAIRADFSLTHGSFGLVYSLATLGSAATLAWLGRRIDDVDLRLFTTLVCSGLIIACLAMALPVNVVMLCAALYLLRLTGQGLMSHTGITTAARYFDADRGKALGVTSMGFAAGEAIFPSVAVALLVHFTWRQSWALLGAGITIILLPGVLALLRGQAARHAAWLRDLARTHDRDDPEADGAIPPRQWALRDVLRDRGFYMVMPAVIAPAFIVTGLFFHQLHIVDTKGWTPEWFAACFIGFAATQPPAALIAGRLVDRLGVSRPFALYLLPLAAGIGTLALGRHSGIALAFLGLAGVTSGQHGPVINAMWAERYGVLHLGSIRAFVGAVMVLSTALSPALMGILIDRGTSVEAIALSCIAFIAVCTGLAVASRKPGRGAA